MKCVSSSTCLLTRLEVSHLTRRLSLRPHARRTSRTPFTSPHAHPHHHLTCISPSPPCAQPSQANGTVCFPMPITDFLRLQALFAEVAAFFALHKIRWLLSHGSLLGAWVHHTPVPWVASQIIESLHAILTLYLE